MRDGLLGVPEKCIGSPDLFHHEVIQTQDFDGALELQTLIDPHLTEEHVHGVVLLCEQQISTHLAMCIFLVKVKVRVVTYILYIELSKLNRH